MILNLYVENYVIIEKVSLDFKQGFSCFTGETGAGKSLVVDALGILLGNRFTGDLIRQGADFCRIEATVKIENPAITDELADNGYSSEESYIFTRELKSDNRAFCRINGRSCTVTLMKSILSQIIDIHSQHDNQYLLNKKYHLSLLDRYVDDPLLNQVKTAFDSYHQLAKELKELREKKYNPNELEFLEYQVNEINELQLREGELEELETRFKQISNYEKTVIKLEEAIHSLNKHDLKEYLWQAIKELEGFTEEQLITITTKLKEAYYLIEEGSGQLVDYRSGIDYTEVEIDAIQSRLHDIKKIQRKFGDSYEAINQKMAEMQATIAEIYNSEELLANLEKEVEQALADFRVVALQYRQVRQAKAEQLVAAIKINLNDLDLPNSRFEVVFTAKEPSADGLDNVEFLLSTNKNVDLRPLAKVASGGELSRIMLGLKIIFTALQGITTIVFDEIDTGVSGTTAFAVGQKMQQLAKSLQVLSVTHLAQVATCAANHYYVNKVLIHDNTTTIVDLLNQEERIQQLAVLGFGMINDDSLKAARLLFDEGQKAYLP